MNVSVHSFKRQISVFGHFTRQCRRASQRQDRPQSDNRGGSGWEQLHLDTNHSQLDLVQPVQRWSGM